MGNFFCCNIAAIPIVVDPDSSDNDENTLESPTMAIISLPSFTCDSQKMGHERNEKAFYVNNTLRKYILQSTTLTPNTSRSNCLIQCENTFYRKKLNKFILDNKNRFYILLDIDTFSEIDTQFKGYQIVLSESTVIPSIMCNGIKDALEKDNIAVKLTQFSDNDSIEEIKQIQLKFNNECTDAQIEVICSILNESIRPFIVQKNVSYSGDDDDEDADIP